MSLASNPRRLASMALIAGLLLPASGAPQDDIETESITEQGTLDPFAVEDRDLQPIFEEAERLFRSFEQPDSIPLFDRLIARLEADHLRKPLPPELLRMLILSRSHRAEANFNLGESERVAEDFERILQLDPTWQIDPDMVSPKLVEVVDELRRQMVGELLVLVEPLDARVTVGGRVIETVGQPTPVLAGVQPLVIRRPGYDSIEEDIEIRAGQSATVEHTLERLSMVARMRVSPPGAAVLVDGEPAQVADRRLITDTEEEIAIEGLLPGKHRIEYRLAEYRAHQYGFDSVELADYELPPVVLELMQGEIRLAELLGDAIVTFNGDERSAIRIGEGTATFALPPADYLIEVRQPGVGGFRHEISLGDQEIVEIGIRLQPTIAFLGVLGADRLAASDLSGKLGSKLGALGDWLWSDHSIDAPAVLDAAGLTAPEMRRLSALASRRAAPDWAEVQARFDREFGASVYLLAVLADDLYATRADLWLWSPAPWPATPGIRTASIQSGEKALDPLVAAFDATALPGFLRLGARFIEAEGVVASSVLAGGPALAAGLAPGDRILDVAGEPISTVADLHARARRRAGGELLLRIAAGDAEPREVRLPVAIEPGVLSLTDRDIIDQVVAARLAIELQSETQTPSWLLELNRAALYLRAMAYTDAVPLLRTIEAPEVATFGRPMVDYWLGSTLMALDPRTYADAARGALERALRQPQARLYHADGPLLAPRARARLAELDRGLAD